MRVRSGLGIVIAGTLALCCSARGRPEQSTTQVTGGTTAGGASSVGPGVSGASGSLMITTPDPSAPEPDEPTGPVSTCSKDCLDFPELPVLDADAPTPVPANAATLFGAADNMSGTGVCVLEPQLGSGADKGALFPANWLRPRFRWAPLAGENVWEIRLHADAETRDLVGYTTSTAWAVPRDIWKKLANNIHNQPITVTIRGLNSSAPGKPSGTVGTFEIAPVWAEGTMVYWAATSQAVDPKTSKLAGFRVGDEGVIDALTIEQAGNRQFIDVTGQQLRVTPDPGAIKEAGHVQCIGCHVSTPDGEAVAFTDVWPWNLALASVQMATVGQQPAYVTPGAARLLNQPWLGMSTFSKGLWDSGKKILVSAYTKRVGDIGFSSMPGGGATLAWFDLTTTSEFPWTPGGGAALNAAITSAEGKSWGRINLMGETAAAISPSFSHDGSKIAYTSATKEQDGRIGDGNTAVDVHVVPFASGMGGPVTPLMGAAEANAAEYYPAYSANDALVAFNRVSPMDGAAMYYRKEGEIYVVPAAGGSAQRLVANDPAACAGEKSPGVTNSWAKWSPTVPSAEGKNYYFLIFSSARKYEGSFNVSPTAPSSQLYMAAIVEDAATHVLTSYGSVYLWNQDAKTSNLTPAWDTFKIPKVPEPVK
jgi:hypothetical protein